MPELYNQVRQSNSKFVPQFVGSNFDTLKAVGDNLQDRYTLNEQKMTDALAASLNEQYAPGDEGIGLGIYKDLSDIRDQIAGSDQSFENSSTLVKQAVRDKILTNRDRIEGLRNAAEYRKYQDQLTALGADAVDFTPKFKGTKNADGTYNRFKGDVQKRLDYDKQKEQYFNQIEADLRQKGYTQDQINAEFLKSTIEGGISTPTIAQHAKNAFERHKTTSEYQQEKRKLMYDGLSAQEADASIRNSILKTGLERVYSVNKEDLQRHSEAYLKGMYEPQEGVPFTGTSPGAAKVNNSATPLVDSFNTDRQMTEPEKVQFIKDNPYAGATGFLAFPKKKVEGIAEDQPGSFIYQFNHVANNLSDRQARIAPKNKEEFKKAHEEAMKSASNIVESGEQLTKENTPIYENFLKGAGLNSPTVLEGESESKTLKEIITSMNLDKNDKIELVPSLLNRTSPNKALGANLEGTIYVNGKPFKSFNTRLSDQFDTASTELNDVFQNSLYKGSDTYTKEQPKVSNQIIRTKEGDYAPVYFTTTIPVQGGKYPFDTEVHVGIAKITYNQDGTPVIEEPKYNNEVYTADEFKAYQTEISRRKLKNTYGSGQMRDLDLKSFGTE